MNLTKEQIAENTIILKVDIEKDDYFPKYEKALRDTRKQASFRGFRPGKAPMSLIKKMYGKELFMEELNKVLSEGVTEYIKNENLSLLGEPIEHHSIQEGIDFNNPTNYSFEFEMGLRPDFEIDIDENITLPIYDIAPTKEELDDYILDIRKREGTIEDVEIIEDEMSIVTAVFSTKPVDELKARMDKKRKENETLKNDEVQTEEKDDTNSNSDETTSDEKPDDSSIDENKDKTIQETDTEDIQNEKTEEESNEETIGDDDDLYSAMFMLKFIKDENVRDSLMGLAIGDVTTFNPYKAIKNETELTSMFQQIEKDNITILDTEFNVYIQNIRAVKSAELGKDLFKKVTGDEKIETFQQFEEAIKNQLIEQYKPEADNKMFSEFREYIIAEKDLQLPDEFLKKWLLKRNEDITKKDIEENYANMRKGFVWELILNEIKNKYKIEVTEKETEEIVTYLAYQDVMQQKVSVNSEKDFQNIVNQRLENEKHVDNLNNFLFERKIIDLLLEKITLDKKQISIAEYKVIFEDKPEDNDDNEEEDQISNEENETKDSVQLQTDENEENKVK